MPHPLPSWLSSSADPWAQEQASVFGDGPLLVADAHDGAKIVARSAFQGAIVVGVDDAGALPPAHDAFDILLTTAAAPPRPWVQVDAIAPALETLRAAIANNPHAAVTLGQVLRAQQTLAFVDALMVESFAYSTLLGGAEFRRWRAAKPRTAARAPSGPALTVARADTTLRITLARPDDENALRPDMRDQLVETLRAAKADTTTRTVEIDAQGPAFCTGGAFDDFGTAADLALAHHIRTIRSVALALHQIEAHTRAIVQGAVVGGGLEFAAAAKEIIAHPAAFFRLPEVSMGLIPGAGGTVTVARRIGWQRTFYMALSGVHVRTRTARAWGLIDRIGDA
jgi:hypothetical protein